MKDKIVAICSTVNSAGTKGIDAFCTKCGVKVWLSDSTIKNLRSTYPERDLEVDPPALLCETCGLPLLLGDDAEIMAPTPEQAREVISAIKKMKDA